MFGGLDSLGTRVDGTWEWNGSKWSRVTGPKPSPRQGVAMGYDMVNFDVMMFGGEAATGVRDDGWFYTTKAIFETIGPGCGRPMRLTAPIPTVGNQDFEFAVRDARPYTPVAGWRVSCCAYRGPRVSWDSRPTARPWCSINRAPCRG